MPHAIDPIYLSPSKSDSLCLLRFAVDTHYQLEVWLLNRTRNAGAVNHVQLSSFAIANRRLVYPVAALGRKGKVLLALGTCLTAGTPAVQATLSPDVRHN
ncbi:hypothetical protein [Janthinobacterium sp. DSP2-3-3]|uniref:hypothetical protein n=1 Tax=Janthinobacterium sp. DSP2-3-3 TaxID=2804596 RepID=UPI003CF034CB